MKEKIIFAIAIATFITLIKMTKEEKIEYVMNREPIYKGTEVLKGFTESHLELIIERIKAEESLEKTKQNDNR
jgi:hypothetical protein